MDLDDTYGRYRPNKLWGLKRQAHYSTTLSVTRTVLRLIDYSSGIQLAHYSVPPSCCQKSRC